MLRSFDRGSRRHKTSFILSRFLEILAMASPNGAEIALILVCITIIIHRGGETIAGRNYKLPHVHIRLIRKN